MKRLYLQDDWPAAWKYSYPFDLLEIYGATTNRGYAYAYENRRDTALGLLTEAVPVGGRVLDIAGAAGNFTLALAERGYDVTWNDLRADLADYVRAKWEHGRVTYAPGNAFELQFPHLFDAVLITEVIEHVAHPDQFLAKTAGLVRPGGTIVMTTPNGAYFRNNLPRFSDCPDPSQYESVQFQPDSEGHIFLLYPEEIPPLAAAAGLSIDKLLLITNTLTNGHMKTQALLRILPRGLVRAIESLTQRLPNVVKRKVSIQLAVRFRKAEV